MCRGDDVPNKKFVRIGIQTQACQPEHNDHKQVNAARRRHISWKVNTEHANSLKCVWYTTKQLTCVQQASSRTRMYTFTASKLRYRSNLLSAYIAVSITLRQLDPPSRAPLSLKCSGLARSMEHEIRVTNIAQGTLNVTVSQ